MSAIKPGWVWIPGDKGKFRPFTEFRQIIKGKDQGRVEITLPATPQRKVIVDKTSIRSYPRQEQINMLDFANGLLAGPKEGEI